MTHDAFPPLIELLPHRGAAVLLDRVLELGPSHARCAASVRAKMPYLIGDRMPAVACLEMMAQTAAVAGSFEAQPSDQGSPPRKPAPGWIAQVVDFDLRVKDLPVGDVLEATATGVFRGKRSQSFSCTVARGGEPIARATITIFVGTDDTVDEDSE